MSSFLHQALRSLVGGNTLLFLLPLGPAGESEWFYGEFKNQVFTKYPLTLNDSKVLTLFADDNGERSLL